MLSRRPILSGNQTSFRQPARFLVSRRYRSTKRPISNTVARPIEDIPALARLPTKLLLRSLFLTSLMTSKVFLRPSLAILSALATSKSILLNPDRNPLLNKLLRWTVYNHFCAGTNSKEVLQSVNKVKEMGYQGVILGYSKEFVLNHHDHPTIDAKTGSKNYSPRCYEMIKEWKEGTLQTLRMIDRGDFLAVKLTGAGPIAVDAMQARQPMPNAFEEALHEICQETEKQGSRLWLDAEQQVLQHGLDDWALELMCKFNKEKTPLVYNTIQSYLKGSKANIDRHIVLAATQGWTLGVKLVRGAYIEHETRSLIHNTKEETDRSYDLLADRLINQRLPVGAENLKFPPAALFLATHNTASATKAIQTHQQRSVNNLPTVLLECGQIQGMAEELSCELAKKYDQCSREAPLYLATAPRAFKCLTWGSVAECIGYLHRRAIENKGAVERSHHMRVALAKELQRRIFGG